MSLEREKEIQEMTPSVDEKLGGLSARVDNLQGSHADIKKSLDRLLDEQRRMPGKVSRRVQKAIQEHQEQCRKEIAKINQVGNTQEVSLLSVPVMQKLGAILLGIGTVIGGILYGLSGGTLSAKQERKNPGIGMSGHPPAIMRPIPLDKVE